MENIHHIIKDDTSEQTDLYQLFVIAVEQTEARE